jgi:general secretion pathway protein H
MPMSTSDQRQAQLGFTLIELLVVLLLVGLALGVTLRVGIDQGPQALDNETRRLAVSLTLMSQEAVLDNKLLGLDFFTDDLTRQTGYRWLHKDGTAWSLAETGDQMTAEILLESAGQIELVVEGHGLEPEPRTDLADPATASTFAPEVLLLSTREMTPFVLTLHSENNTSKLSADRLGQLYLNEDAPRPPL